MAARRGVAAVLREGRAGAWRYTVIRGFVAENAGRQATHKVPRVPAQLLALAGAGQGGVGAAQTGVVWLRGGGCGARLRQRRRRRRRRAVVLAPEGRLAASQEAGRLVACARGPLARRVLARLLRCRGACCRCCQRGQAAREEGPEGAGSARVGAERRHFFQTKNITFVLFSWVVLLLGRFTGLGFTAGALTPNPVVVNLGGLLNPLNP